MIEIKDKRDCCGCTACASICPHNAITMKPDDIGFMYPVVDTIKCIDCGLCEKVCAFNDNYEKSLNFKKPIAYASRHKDVNEVMASRSGATFVALSDYVLSQGGVVYGAGFTGHFRVTHKRATTKDERDEFRGSKYVQSDLNGIFLKVKEDLNEEKLVLFSGTPCQTAGLNSFIGKKIRNRLILVDIICHGVSSPYLWRDYLSYLEEKEGKMISSVNFRDKEKFGWAAHYETFCFENSSGEKRSYDYTIYQSFAFRDSCNICHFSNITRPSDITIGDLWGWQNVCPDMNKDDKGINLVLLNTEKGVKVFEKIKEVLIVKPLKEGTYLQHNLLAPTPRHSQKIVFENDYKRRGGYYVLKHDYNKENIFIRAIHLMKKNIEKYL